MLRKHGGGLVVAPHDSPYGAWVKALLHFQRALVECGGNVEPDFAHRLFGIFSRRGSASHVARWWLLLRTESVPMTAAELRCLAKHDLWREAAYSLQVLRSADRASQALADAAPAIFAGVGHWRLALHAASLSVGGALQAYTSTSGSSSGGGGGGGGSSALPAPRERRQRFLVAGGTRFRADGGATAGDAVARALVLSSRLSSWEVALSAATRVMLADPPQPPRVVAPVRDVCALLLERQGMWREVLALLRSLPREGLTPSLCAAGARVSLHHLRSSSAALRFVATAEKRWGAPFVSASLLAQLLRATDDVHSVIHHRPMLERLRCRMSPQTARLVDAVAQGAHAPAAALSGATTATTTTTTGRAGSLSVSALDVLASRQVAAGQWTEALATIGQIRSTPLDAPHLSPVMRLIVESACSVASWRDALLLFM